MGSKSCLPFSTSFCKYVFFLASYSVFWWGNKWVHFYLMRGHLYKQKSIQMQRHLRFGSRLGLRFIITAKQSYSVQRSVEHLWLAMKQSCSFVYQSSHFRRKAYNQVFPIRTAEHCSVRLLAEPKQKWISPRTFQSSDFQIWFLGSSLTTQSLGYTILFTVV